MTALTNIQSQKFPNFREGLVLKIPVSGLLPGYVIDFAEIGSSPLFSYRPISTVKGSSPRLSDVVALPDKTGVVIRIIVPFLTGETTPRTYYVRSPQSRRFEHTAPRAGT